MSQVEQTNCPLCGSEQSRRAYSGFSPYSVAQCNACKFYYLSPRLTEAAMLAEYQKDNYFEGDDGGYDSYVQQESALRATFHRFLRNLERQGVCGGSLLEIGCGYGYLLDEATSYFQERFGTDFSAQAVQQAEKSQATIYRGGATAVPKHERFNCIISTHVIEHVYEPELFLRSLKEHLLPGGKIIIATPDMGSPWRRVMGKRWPSFKMPEHILYFDQSSLSSLMHRVGFRDLQTVPYPHAFPLPLIASKLNLRVPRFLQRFNFWLPGTTLAICGTLEDV